MRHLVVLAALIALLAGVYFWLQTKTVVVEGRVFLQEMDGREKAGVGAKVAWHPADVIEEHLRAWLGDREERQRDNELRVRAARNEWNQKVAARDEAAGILRVAERANAADLEICRARHREAAADAEDAMRGLEKLLAGADEAADPGRFLAGLPASPVECAADADGRFTVRAPHGRAGYVVASLGQGGERKELLLWLRSVDPEENGEVQFSNGNVLTAESLAKLAREAKNREALQGSPVDAPAK